MKKNLIVLILVAFGFFLGATHSRRVWAAQSGPTPQEGKGCSAPKEWGPIKGVADRNVAFEDSSGTLRILDVGPCMRGETQLIVKIERR
jgi:disulfide bond formation protein DsbB